MKSDVPTIFVAAGRAGNMDCLLVGADDVKSRRLGIDNQHGAGLQSVRQSLATRDLCLGEPGDIEGEESDARGAAD